MKTEQYKYKYKYKAFLIPKKLDDEVIVNLNANFICWISLSNNSFLIVELNLEQASNFKSVTRHIYSKFFTNLSTNSNSSRNCQMNEALCFTNKPSQIWDEFIQNEIKWWFKISFDFGYITNISSKMIRTKDKQYRYRYR